MSKYAIFDKANESYVTKDFGADEVFDCQLHDSLEGATNWFNRYKFNPELFSIVEIFVRTSEVALYLDEETKTYKALEAY